MVSVRVFSNAFRFISVSARTGRPSRLRSFKVVRGVKTSCAGSEVFLCPTETSTKNLAGLFARELKPGDCYCLRGDIGTGKSVFSRAFIRAAYEDDELPVPSPTYLLQNIYDDIEGPPIHHFDLYRVDHPLGVERLSLEYSFQHAVSLIEWPEILKDKKPPSRMDIEFSIVPKNVQCKWELDRKDQVDQMLMSINDFNEDNEEDDYGDFGWRVVKFSPHGIRFCDTLEYIVSNETFLQQGFALLTGEMLASLEKEMKKCP